jgi:ParB-like chromosome segregation protein Spo0J
MTGIYKLPEYDQHPIAMALMPGGMDETEFNAFCEDIEERGIIMPVTLYEGKVLDGWHRYRAAKRTGSAPKFIEYTGKDPAGYIASVNVHRRKLSSLQRALVGARLHRDHGLTQREACKKLGISNEVITLVLKTMDSKNTKLIKKIEDDGDFTRGMLKEELEDAGLLRAKPKAEVDVSTLTNSVFDMGRTAHLSPDTDGSEDDVDELLGTGKGLKTEQRAAKKPQKTAAQTMQEEYEALMHDEKLSFLKMIWPTASKLLTEAGLEAPKKPAGKKAKDVAAA